MLDDCASQLAVTVTIPGVINLERGKIRHASEFWRFYPMGALGPLPNSHHARGHMEG